MLPVIKRVELQHAFLPEKKNKWNKKSKEGIEVLRANVLKHQGYLRLQKNTLSVAGTTISHALRYKRVEYHMKLHLMPTS